VTFGKLLNIFEPQFPHLIVKIIILNSEVHTQSEMKEVIWVILGNNHLKRIIVKTNICKNLQFCLIKQFSEEESIAMKAPGEPCKQGIKWWTCHISNLPPKINSLCFRPLLLAGHGGILLQSQHSWGTDEDLEFEAHVGYTQWDPVSKKDIKKRKK
jgi:hypothetical protein